MYEAMIEGGSISENVQRDGGREDGTHKWLSTIDKGEIPGR